MVSDNVRPCGKTRIVATIATVTCNERDKAWEQQKDQDAARAYRSP